MKATLAAAIAALAVFAVRAEAGPNLPKPTSLVGRHPSNYQTHFVRDDPRPRLPRAASRVESGTRHRGTRLTHPVRGGR